MLTSSAITLIVNLQSDQTSSVTCTVLSPAHLQQGFCLQKTLCPHKACALDIASSPKVCWSFPCIVVALSPSVCVCVYIKDGWGAYCCVIFRASIFMTRFTNNSWHVEHLLHTETLHSHANASEDGGRTKVKGCPC
jgi:hypothetical protein